MKNARSFFAELKRRNVLRAGVLYAGAVWALAQGLAQLLPLFGPYNWVARWFVVAGIIGFPFWMVLAWFYQWTSHGLQRESEIAPNESSVRRPSRRLDRAIIAILAFAVVLLLTNQFVARRDTNSSRVSVPIKSIAVLPLANSTGNPANEYFSDGMSEEFISSLSRLQGLKVIGRTSSFQFKGKTADSRTIGEKLGVYYLLEGSVRKSADRVRIAVDLVKSADGASIWSETYDRELKDIFAVQSEIAGAVAKQLKVALLGSSNQVPQLPPTATPSGQNVQAYNALLQGNFYYERRTAADIRKAISYYEEATRLEPTYALATAKLSLANETLASNYAGNAKDKQELAAKARSAAEKALQLDPDLAEAHLAKGRVLADLDFDFVGAEREHRRAHQLAPQNPDVTRNLASLLSFLGRFDEAVTLTKQAIELDPLRSAAEFTLANYLIALGHYNEAEAAMRKAIALQPQSAQNYAQLVRIHILRGEPDLAVQLAKQETDPFWRTYGLALAYFASGDRSNADAELKKLVERNADDAGSQIASVYALRKEPEKMFVWLEHAWSTHDPGVMELLADPFLRAYKDDARFIAIARKIGVMPQPSAQQEEHVSFANEPHLD